MHIAQLIMIGIASPTAVQQRSSTVQSYARQSERQGC